MLRSMLVSFVLFIFCDNHGMIDSLHDAVQHGDKERINFFLASTDINAVDLLGLAPIHMTACIASSEVRYDVLRLLLEKKADPNLKSFTGTVLSRCVRNNNQDEIRLLLENKAQLATEDLKITLSCSHHYISPEVVELLLQQCVNDQKGNILNDEFLLHYLINQKNFNDHYDENLIKLKMLLTYGADIGLQNGHGDTIFHYMIRENMGALAQDCLEKPRVLLKNLLCIKKAKESSLHNVPKPLLMHIAYIVNPCCKIILDKRLNSIFLFKNIHGNTLFDMSNTSSEAIKNLFKLKG